LARAIISRIFAPLLSARGAAILRSAWAALLLAFAPALAVFLGAAALVLPSLAVFLALGAPFFWLAPFFEVAFSGATCAACAATAAVLSVVYAVVMWWVSLSALASRMSLDRSGRGKRQAKSEIRSGEDG
jgi:hypothetical protein